MAVVNEVGVVLVRVTAQESVVALEASPKGPAVVRSGGAHLLGRGQVPLSDRESVVAMRHQHLGQESILERDLSIRTGVPGRPLGDARHRV